MSKLSKEYLKQVINLIEKISVEEEDAINQAANMMADAIQKGHKIFAFGCSHSSLPVQDIYYRAGGLMLINPIFAPGIASLDIHPVTMTSGLERLEGLAKVLLDNYPTQKDDVLILVSVSGRNAVPIEMAKIAKERGTKVIGVTSRKYTEGVTSRHSSGRKMYEYADVVLDNKVDKGDAVIEVEGVAERFTPASGVTSTALLHALITATIEELLKRGITPPIYVAANVDGGEEHNAKLKQQYKDQILNW
ncbi:sugar isomerase domain-containing protein [Candidatus Cryosericum septentrionale]|jgi:uncharacterized phosphosugar-binding protein|uniref:Sugar isomerase domain-containing protein n=1 Tax=Candidatus Cryosericum septentrionale TaxID=2290913 RepID=A0A398DMV1_9BACT|nr:SIS domain-containing protein [Candidatus Cryosericum septentrionale]RIE16280.1 sugar isomerase domain-containing protein [Candidatus Cryosericum septentrionale]